ELVREMRVEWFEPYRHVMDASRGPEWTTWFLGGRLNIAHNCVDRWTAADRPACIWEAENGATRTVSFADLQRESNRVANGLTAVAPVPSPPPTPRLPLVP